MIDFSVIPDDLKNSVFGAILLVVVALSLAVYFFVIYGTKYRRYKKQNEGLPDYLVCDIAYFYEIGKRNRQEDSFYISPMNKMRQNGIICLVSDGMGGLQFGDEISKYITDKIESLFPLEFNSTETNSDMIKKISDEIYEKYKLIGGATFAMVHIKDDMMHFYSVGDSNIILYRDGKTTLINPKQNYRSIMIKKYSNSNKTTRELYTNSSTKALVDFMGNSNTRVYYSQKPIRILHDDIIIVSSDGLTDAIPVNNIYKYANGSARTIAERFKINVRTRRIKKQDNYTGIVIKMERSLI